MEKDAQKKPHWLSVFSTEIESRETPYSEQNEVEELANVHKQMFVFTHV